MGVHEPQQKNNQYSLKSGLRLCGQYCFVSVFVLLLLRVAFINFRSDSADDLDYHNQPSFPNPAVRFIDGERKSMPGDNKGVLRLLSWTKSPEGEDADWFKGLQEPTCDTSDAVTCVYTSNPYDLEHSDAALMALKEYPDYGFPTFRYKSQKWIYVHTGSVDNQPWIAAHAHLFNTTSAWPSSTPYKLPGSKPVKSSVVTFLNKCDVTSDSRTFIRELSAYVKIDVYGECGNKTCKHPSECESLISNYHFYLVMREETVSDVNRENFIFQNSPIIPVFREDSLADQLKLPVGSFLRASHFNSSETFGEHLHDLGRNADKYSEMVQRKYDLMRMNRYFCELCRVLHLNRDKKQVIDDIRDIHL